MENTQTETVETNAETATEATVTKPEVSVQTETVETITEAEALRKALENERKAHKETKAQIAKQSRTEAERVTDLEQELKTLRIERITNKAIADAIAAVGDSHSVSLADVTDLLEDANLTEDNVKRVVEKVVRKVAKPNSVQTPDNAAPTVSVTKPEPSLRNPWVGFNS